MLFSKQEKTAVTRQHACRVCRGVASKNARGEKKQNDKIPFFFFFFKQPTRIKGSREGAKQT